VFSEVHPKFRTPAKNNLLFLVFVSLFAAFVPARVVGEMTSIGTLFAFILVCIGVIIMRKTMPNAPRAFVTPLVPLIPILGVFTCLFMMVFLPLDTWIRLIVWMIIGLDVYLAYSVRHSILSAGSPDTIPQGNKIGGICGLSLSVILAIVAFVHHTLTLKEAAEALAKGVKLEDVPTDNGIFYFSLVFAGLHALYFLSKMLKKS
jgi:APA family basic amino acid/polyamine antiporter